MFIFRNPKNQTVKPLSSRKAYGDDIPSRQIATVEDGAAHDGSDLEVGLVLHMDDVETNNEILQPKVGSGLYVDMENIQNGQVLIEAAIATWPERFPKPIRLCLHVRGDQVELWRLWASHKFANMNLIVKGTQKFSGSTSKNSADMAIATNAMADWILGRVSHVAVLSNDSDFISLYVSMREEMVRARGDDNVPFLWVITDEGGGLSPTAEQFFPTDKLHMVSMNGGTAYANASDNGTVSEGQAESSDSVGGTLYDQMARAIIQDISVGSFKSTDCQEVIQRRWPDHKFGAMDGAHFGQAFKENVWPMLRVRGVRMTNPANQSVRYEMTEAAKRT